MPGPDDKDPRKRVFIVVLNWNGAADTQECVESLKKLVRPAHSLLVVDNGSMDDSVEVLRVRFPDLDIIETKRNLGFAGGANLGIRHALNQGAEYVIVLKNDTVVDADFAYELAAAAEADRAAGVLSSKVYLYGSPDILRYAGGSFNRWLGWGRLRGYNERDGGRYSALEETERAGGGSLMVTREFCVKVGLFDEEYFSGCEEMDLGMRAKKAGYKVLFVPGSKVWHKESESTEGAGSGISLYYMVRNTLKCLDKNSPIVFPLRFFRYSTVAATSLLSLFKMKIPKARGFRMILRAFADHFMGRYGAFRP